MRKLGTEEFKNRRLKKSLSSTVFFCRRVRNLKFSMRIDSDPQATVRQVPERPKVDDKAKINEITTKTCL